MSDIDIDLVKKYLPYIFFDLNEPFVPRMVGYTLFKLPGKSPSFKRNVEFDIKKIKFAIEYAIYWDFDIEHLYELEHIWVYVGYNNEVVDCEGSFHGKYIKGLFWNEMNVEDDTHVFLYSQPGKHAFAPDPKIFKLVPNLYKAAWENVGREGLTITEVGEGRYTTNEKINDMVRSYMQIFKFKPSMEFKKYKIPENILVPWEKLNKEIPNFINNKLKEIKNKL